MHLPAYSFIYNESFTIFEFQSDGPKGPILKRIEFQLTSFHLIYNLVLGDVNLSNGKTDDFVTTNNLDTQKVLVTTIQIIYFFIDKYPKSSIFIHGNTPSRNRLYRMAISRFLQLSINDFDIFCLENNQWIPFDSNKQATSFLIYKKRILLLQ
jgi:hypothetical protein